MNRFEISARWFAVGWPGPAAAVITRVRPRGRP